MPKDPPKVKRRVRIPDKPNYSLNLWSIMKNCIGRELSKIPMPVGALEGWPHWVPWGCFLVRGLELMARVKLRQPPPRCHFLNDIWEACNELLNRVPRAEASGPEGKNQGGVLHWSETWGASKHRCIRQGLTISCRLAS